MNNITERINQNGCISDDVLSDIYAFTRGQQTSNEQCNKQCAPKNCGNKRATYGYSLDKQLKEFQEKKDNNPEARKEMIQDICKEIQTIKSALNRASRYRKAPTLGESNSKCLCSFPATIRTVRPLGCKALLITWVIHSFVGLSGYKICVDGCKRIRLYSASHDSAVVNNIDLCKKHLITLHSVPCKDLSEETQKKEDQNQVPAFVCRLLPVSYFSSSNDSPNETPLPRSWTPSCYIYDPNNNSDKSNVDEGVILKILPIS